MNILNRLFRFSSTFSPFPASRPFFTGRPLALGISGAGAASASSEEARGETVVGTVERREGTRAVAAPALLLLGSARAEEPGGVAAVRARGVSVFGVRGVRGARTEVTQRTPLHGLVHRGATRQAALQTRAARTHRRRTPGGNHRASLRLGVEVRGGAAGFARAGGGQAAGGGFFGEIF